MSEIPAPTWSGTIKALGIDLKCHVLESGQRIVEPNSLCALMDALSEPGDFDPAELDEFARWQQGADVGWVTAYVPRATASRI